MGATNFSKPPEEVSRRSNFSSSLTHTEYPSILWVTSYISHMIICPSQSIDNVHISVPYFISCPATCKCCLVPKTKLTFNRYIIGFISQVFSCKNLSSIVFALCVLFSLANIIIYFHFSLECKMQFDMLFLHAIPGHLC